MKNFFIGIDGGLSGGIVVLDNEMNVNISFQMPTMKNSSGNTYDIQRITEIFKYLVRENSEVKKHFFLEKAQVRPISGKRSCFTNGYCFGIFEGILTSLGVSYEIVSPQMWMNKVGLKKKQGEKKDKPSIEWCIKKFPNHNWRKSDRSKKHHDGLTDACGIAYYGILKFNGGLEHVLID